MVMMLAEGAIQVVMIVVFLIIAVVGMYFGHKAAKKRRSDLLALSGRMGLSFSEGHDSYHDEEFGHFELISRGFGRSANNTLSGGVKVGGQPMRVKMGDYKYKTREGSGKNRRTVTHRFSYCIVMLPWEGMPGVLIRREGFFDKISSAFGFDDIDFESGEFSKKYFVKSPNKKLAYDICHPRMIEWLLETEPAVVDMERGRLCMTEGSRVWKVERFEYTLGWVDRFIEQWPDFVVKDLEEGKIV